MCIILDANLAHKFGQPPHDDVKPVVLWLLNRKHLNQTAIGGKLREELALAGPAIRRFLIQLKRAGRLFEVADALVDSEERIVVKLMQKSAFEDADDPHIIALARVCGSRLLVSHDARSKLHELFKARQFLDPPGKIYQEPSKAHIRLLWECPKCKHR